MTRDRHTRLGESAEFEIVRRMLEVWGDRAVGIGDDAAVLSTSGDEQIVVSTDASIENVHFRREWLSTEQLGERATAAALSDLAAMAARPIGLLLALGVPSAWDHDIVSIAHGVGSMAERAGCPIVGGNLARAGELSITITVLGHARGPLLRSGARVGDDLYVTGVLGGPKAALDAFLAGQEPSEAARSRFIAPQPRIREARWLAQRGAKAAIDISDGLLADAANLGRASGVTLLIDAGAVPRLDGVSLEDALISGEEYELLVTMADDGASHLADFTHAFGLPLTRIGTVVSAGSEPVELRGARVDPVRGYDHFS